MAYGLDGVEWKWGAMKLDGVKVGVLIWAMDWSGVAEWWWSGAEWNGVEVWDGGSEMR
jgi:hypothetical protein